MKKKEKELLKAAFDAIDEYNIKRIEAMPNVETHYSEEYQRTIDSMLERSKKKKPCLGLRKAILIGAAILIVVVTATACTFKPVRDFIIEFFTGETQLSSECEAEDFSESFVIGVLPAGFELLNKESLDTSAVTRYTDGSETIKLNYGPYSEVVISLDTEGAECKNATVNDFTVYTALKNGTYTAVWRDGDYSFKLRMPESLGWDALIQMVESVEPDAEAE